MSLSALLLIALPAAAAHTPAHTSEEIWAVVSTAEQSMGAVVDSFEAAIASMDDPGAVEAAEAAAKADITVIWTEARNDVDDLAMLYPALNQEAGAAKQQLAQLRVQSRDQISEQADAWTAPVPVTTSTTLVVTTTTITVGTTTTTHAEATGPPVSPGAGNGGNGNGTGNGNGNGNEVQEQESPADPPSPEVQVTPDPVGESATAESQEPIDASGLEFVSQTSVIAMAQDMPKPVVPIDEVEDGAITSQVSAMLETVLPPAIVDVVLSPLLVFEILSKTIMADGQKVLVPLSLLALCAMVIGFGDRLSAGSSRLFALIRK